MPPCAQVTVFPRYSLLLPEVLERGGLRTMFTLDKIEIRITRVCAVTLIDVVACLAYKIFANNSGKICLLLRSRT